VRVACVLTTTPLARQHAHRLATSPSRPREIPWARFDREGYAAGALAIASQSARSLAAGEYGAVTLFAHAASALALHRAPFDLIATAARIPADEIRHAEYACRMAALCAGTDLSSLDLDVDDAVLTARCAPIRNLEDLDVFMLELPAVSETLATALLDACREGATDPVARAFFANIVRDEVHHARLGWYYLAWRAAQWSDAERQRLADRAGEIVMEVDRRFQRGRDAPPDIAGQARRLGVLDTTRQREVIQRVMEEEIVPGLDALGLGASYAWNARRATRSPQSRIRGSPRHAHFPAARPTTDRQEPDDRTHELELRGVVV
jgi:hypothetical protein